jgi:hypothetical protein
MSSYKPAALFGPRPSPAPAPFRLDPPVLVTSESETSTRSSLTYVSDESDTEKPEVKPEQPTLNGASPRVSTLARRIHGWSWQAVRLARPGALVTSVLSPF